MARNTSPNKTYLWCPTCRRSFSHADAPTGACPVCAGSTREMSRLAAIARGFMANELTASPLESKHRQLLRLIWTRNGMGERYYGVLAPDIPYNRFEAKVTALLTRGAEEGWVRFVFPAAPTADESAYRVEFDDEERFVRELEALVEGDGVMGAEGDRITTWKGCAALLRHSCDRSTPCGLLSSLPITHHPSPHHPMTPSPRDRLHAALSGDVADRPPVALWRHFPEEDQTAAGLAAATVNWQREFPGDFVKFMVPGDSPTIDWGLRSVYDGAPSGTRRPIFHPVTQASDWARLPGLDVREGFHGEMLAAVRMAKRDLPPDVPLLQTIFSPLTIAAKLSDGRVAEHLSGSPAAVHAGLRRITEVTRAFAVASLAAGADGVFFATQLADRSLLSEEDYREFGVPYDLQALDALPAGTPLLLHLHGAAPMLDLAGRYPPGALSWHDRRFGPPLHEVARGSGRPVSGGIDEDAILTASEAEVAAQAADAVRQVDGRGLIVAPGCVIPVATPAANIRAVLQAVQNPDAI
ncbi:MAG: uroporphyrinogen decarboxylase family protein [Thermomicrobiales bacterium]